MTTPSAAAADDPRQLLSRTRDLARGVRQAQRATWFPLLVLAAITFAAIPVSRIANYSRTCRLGGPVPGGRLEVCSVYPTATFVYWPIALVLAYAAIAAFYLRRSEARGLGSPIRPFVVAGIVLAVVLTGAGFWAAHHPPLGSVDIAGLHLGQHDYVRLQRILSPAVAIGLALIVLTWIERNLLLAVVTAGYLFVVLRPVTFGWTLVNRNETRPPSFGHVSHWVGVPHLVIDGSILLLAAIGFAIAQRSAEPVTA